MLEKVEWRWKLEFFNTWIFLEQRYSTTRIQSLGLCYGLRLKLEKNYKFSKLCFLGLPYLIVVACFLYFFLPCRLYGSCGEIKFISLQLLSSRGGSGHMAVVATSPTSPSSTIVSRLPYFGWFWAHNFNDSMVLLGQTLTFSSRLSWVWSWHVLLSFGPYLLDL